MMKSKKSRPLTRTALLYCNLLIDDAIKLLHSYGSDVRVHTFVPVQEAFHINGVTDL